MKLIAALTCATLMAFQDPRFGIESRLVLVPVTVTDMKNRTVNGLETSDFVIYDNGVPQLSTVDSSATGVAPIALVVAVQASGISAPVLAKVQKIGAMIQPLLIGERGCAALVTFDESVRWRQECTNDADALTRAFAAVHNGEPKKARMLDAAHQAIARLRKPNVRRVLLLISESRDRGSESELGQVLSAAHVAGVSVYAATYSAMKTAFTTKGTGNEMPRESVIPRPNRTEPLSAQGRVPIPADSQRMDILGGIGELVRMGKTKDTEVLTTGTGGTTFPFTRLKGLENAITHLGEELHSQYILSFAPATPTAGYHRLEVRLTLPGNFRIRSRPGYWWTQ